MECQDESVCNFLALCCILRKPKGILRELITRTRRRRTTTTRVAFRDAFGYKNSVYLKTVYLFNMSINRSKWDKTNLLLASRSVVCAAKTLGVIHEHSYLFTECHIVIGHRHQPRDTWPVNFSVQYGERHITLDFKRRHQTTCGEVN